MAGWRPAILAGLLLTGVAGRAASNPHLARGVRLIEEMEDAKAVRALQRALRVRRNTDQVRAKIHLYLGIAHFNLLDKDRARQELKQACKLDPAIKLPPTTAPKIRELFDSLQPARPPEPETTRPAPVERRPPPPKPRPPPVVVAALDQTPRDSGRGAVGWAAWGTAGLAVAAGGAALTAGLLARSANQQAGDVSLTSGEADVHHEAARERALAANVMFGVAGAAAVAAGVLFYFHLRSGRGWASAAIVPLPGGAALQVTSW